jgi:hypothetical protein
MKPYRGSDEQQHMSDGDEERRKWKLGVFQKNAQDLIDLLDAHRTRYRTLTDSVENIWTTWRNAILSGVSFSAPILLGMYLADIVPDIMLILFIIDVGVGLIVSVILSVIKGKLQAFSLEMDDSFFIAKVMVITFRNYGLANAYNLDKIEEDRIDFFLRFTKFVEAAGAFQLNKVFEKLLKEKLLWRIRPYRRIAKDLAVFSIAQLYIVETGKDDYKKLNASMLSTDQQGDYTFFKKILLPYFVYLDEEEQKQRQTAAATKEGHNPKEHENQV